jgi:two-component system OmpR family sensor kinase
VALLALVCLAVGVVTTVALQHFLVGRLDAQLVAAGGRSADAGRGPLDGSVRPPDGRTGAVTDTGAQFLLTPGQPTGTLGARMANGRLTAAGVLGDDGGIQPLDAGRADVLTRLPVDGDPHSLAIPGLGDYRLVAARMPDGDVLITGLPLRAVNDIVYRLMAVEAIVAVAALLTAALAGVLIVRRSLRPLRRVAATATRVSSLPLEQGEVDLVERVGETDTDPRTEVGQVGAALNRLLDHVGAALTARHASETRVRQFVADASHELRTPLAAIRGYAELTRRNREEVPPDFKYAMGRVESETARMTTLVDDLLSLARLDSGRPLASERLDLSRVLIDAVSDASAADRDHHWRLDLPETPVIIGGDAARLHQVAANLLTNARAHTPAGTTVVTRLTVSGPDEVTLAVLDDGPGVPAELLPHVFERFARGDPSRSRSAGSTGLGLAIVQAIVTAHGGSVHVTSRRGQTAFIVRLPIAHRESVPGLHATMAT